MPNAAFHWEPLGVVPGLITEPGYADVLAGIDAHGWTIMHIAAMPAGGALWIKEGLGVVNAIYRNAPGVNDTITARDGDNGRELFNYTGDAWASGLLMRFARGLLVSLGGAPSATYTIVYA